MVSQKLKRRVVVIGGGTGSYTVLKGLKRYADRLDITAVVSLTDAGGSTGRLRDEFGYLPVGDVRMALVALAREDNEHQDLLRQLFLHRFDRGNGLSGHNVGNLLLVALTDILGSEAEAVYRASRILNVVGRVLPVTADQVHLVATYDDGVTITGEQHIDEPEADRHNRRIVSLTTQPTGRLNQEAAAAIAEAELVIIGPGDLYSSLLANIVIDGMAEALVHSPARLAFVASLMERPGQTRGMTLSAMVTELSRYCGRSPDVVCLNKSDLPADVLARYKAEGNRPIVMDTEKLNCQIVTDDLLSPKTVNQSATDAVKRSLIRHDSDKLARMPVDLLQ